MANAQNKHIARSLMRVYHATDYLMKNDITVLSTSCSGSIPIIRVQAKNTSILEGCVIKNRIVNGVRTNEYQAIESGCLIIWENIYVH